MALAGLTACGDATDTEQPPAEPYSKRSTAPEVVARVTPADYRRPIGRYKRFVTRQLDAMQADTRDLQTAVAGGRLHDARDAWLQAVGRYESIGAAYGAFGELDAAINGRADGLPGGIRSSRFTGLHRIELALWQRRSTGDAMAATAALTVAVTRLRTRLPRLTIDPFEYSLRAHEILEDGIHLQLSGRASPWSGSALVAVRSQTRGTKFVLSTLAPMIARRDEGGALPQADAALGRLGRAIRSLERSDGSLPRWDSVDLRARERVNGAAAAAAEEVAYVPELIDPRPARPAQRPFGDDG